MIQGARAVRSIFAAFFHRALKGSRSRGLSLLSRDSQNMVTQGRVGTPSPEQGGLNPWVVVVNSRVGRERMGHPQEGIIPNYSHVSFMVIGNVTGYPTHPLNTCPRFIPERCLACMTICKIFAPQIYKTSCSMTVKAMRYLCSYFSLSSMSILIPSGMGILTTCLRALSLEPMSTILLCILICQRSHVAFP